MFFRAISTKKILINLFESIIKKHIKKDFTFITNRERIFLIIKI